MVALRELESESLCCQHLSLRKWHLVSVRDELPEWSIADNRNLGSAIEHPMARQPMHGQLNVQAVLDNIWATRFDGEYMCSFDFRATTTI